MTFKGFLQLDIFQKVERLSFLFENKSRENNYNTIAEVLAKEICKKAFENELNISNYNSEAKRDFQPERLYLATLPELLNWFTQIINEDTLTASIQKGTFYHFTCALKLKLYQELLEYRKFEWSVPRGLVNPSTIEYGKFDLHLNPFANWYGNIMATNMVVGQDWGNEEDFKKYAGVDDPGNLTCVRLLRYIQAIDTTFEEPYFGLKTSDNWYFTNVIFGLRPGNKSSGYFNTGWLKDSFRIYKALVHLIQPNKIICLGNYAFNQTLKVFKQKSTLEKGINSIPCGETIIFKVSHPAARPKDRNNEQMQDDWKKIAEKILEK